MQSSKTKNLLKYKKQFKNGPFLLKESADFITFLSIVRSLPYFFKKHAQIVHFFKQKRPIFELNFLNYKHHVVSNEENG